MTHTPGPWMPSQNIDWKTNPFSVIVRKPGTHRTTVANIPTRSTIPPEEQEANARLIAAAPELLDALRDALNCIDNIPERDRARLGLYSMKWYGDARAAIAKATGEA